MTAKSVRVIANANNKALKTANILTSGPNTFKTYTPQTTDSRLWPTIQDSGGTVRGLPTIIVPSGGGGDAFVLQLGGLNLQLGGQDLTLGA